jgi:hypothetical protein
MCFDEVTGDVEAQAEATVVARRHRTLELTEHAIDVGLLNPDAVVSHDQPRDVVLGVERNLDWPARQT